MRIARLLLSSDALKRWWPLMMAGVWLCGATATGAFWWNDKAAGHSLTHADIAKLNCSAVIPPSGQWVADQADIVDAATEEQLAQRFSDYEKKTGHQLIVVTVPALQGRDVANYAQDLGTCWGVGRKEQDDGIVLLIAPKDRKARIAVGYGLEAAVSDGEAQLIMDRDLIPNFRVGNYSKGLDLGSAAIINEIEKK